MPSHFYVDESGDFADLYDAVTAGGPLLKQVLPDLRERLESIMPFFPWPPHAAHLNRPVVWALSAHLGLIPADSRDRLPHDIVTALRRSQNPRLQRSLRLLRQRKWPDIPDLMILEDALEREDPGVIRELRQRMHQARAYIGAVVRSWKEAVAGVLAAEANWRITESPRSLPRTGNHETDRYFDMLAGALRRAQLVTEHSGGRTLEVTVLNRTIYDPAEKRFRRLRKEDLERLVAAFPKSKCHIVVQEIAAWDGSVPAGCVLADFCCSAGRRVLVDPVLSLTTAENRLLEACGLLMRSGNPAMSHLAAVLSAGVSPRASSAHLPKKAKAVPPPGFNQWAWDWLTEERGGPQP